MTEPNLPACFARLFGELSRESLRLSGTGRGEDSMRAAELDLVGDSVLRIEADGFAVARLAAILRDSGNEAAEPAANDTAPGFAEGAGVFREHLSRLGISQNDAARVTGADFRTVRRWAAGSAKLPASVDTLLSVMRKYGLSVDQVIDAWESYG